jgi:hypothetical protein
MMSVKTVCLDKITIDDFDITFKGKRVIATHNSDIYTSKNVNVIDVEEMLKDIDTFVSVTKVAKGLEIMIDNRYLSEPFKMILYSNQKRIKKTEKDAEKDTYSIFTIVHMRSGVVEVSENKSLSEKVKNYKNSGDTSFLSFVEFISNLQIVEIIDCHYGETEWWAVISESKKKYSKVDLTDFNVNVDLNNCLVIGGTKVLIHHT